MLDFTSALYLGLAHSSASLRPWTELTAGVPAALAEPACADIVAARTARLIGCERAVFAPSTLHLFWDLFGTEAFRGRPVFLDDGTYPIARWGADRAAMRGASVARFRHYDAEALHDRLSAVGWGLPVVICDGVCPSCGRAAPVRNYSEVVARFNGTLLVDDTQGLGILGDCFLSGSSWGSGGGGVLRWSGIVGDNVLVINSLAKGFGVPIAVLAGSTRAVRRFMNESETRVHCSPPSVAAIHAAEHALDVNERMGDALRLRLYQLVLRFRRIVSAKQLEAGRGLFPVQSVSFGGDATTSRVHELLLKSGIRTVLHHDRHDGLPRLSFLITARHTPGDIDAAADAVGQAANRGGRKGTNTVFFSDLDFRISQ